ncbi:MULTISPECIES: UBP-type zinc finger domain-containing protein [unclassified Streptomyces]|uniref:UBP-type zinc finger domain-containing protein n=1 Tax=unclassified Streptomyces TaxID=2593676 RepID=UPI0033243734
MADDRIPGIDTSAEPSGEGCAECLAGDGPGWWVHLRRCAACGHIGCCDSSPSQHGTRHAKQEGHPFLTSFEPGEEWFWNVETEQYYEGGPQLPPPVAHPLTQPTPGPEGAVPPDWQQHVN